jgi:hypothetical protein
MKKILLITIVCLMCGYTCPAQTDPSQRDTLENIWDKGKDAWKAWNLIDSIWMDSIYWPNLKQHKLKMTCAHCERILMHVDMKIDSTGKLELYRITRSSICGNEISKKMEDEWMKFFLFYEFPEALRKQAFHVMLGTGLKC